MNIILKHRYEGKTRDLILRSKDTGYRIITSTHMQVEYIKILANEMGVVIPEPADVRSYVSSKKYIDKGILIDEVDYCLNALFGCPVDSVTLNYGG